MRQEGNDLEQLSELNKYFTVFSGSSQEDVSYATVFWNSVTLQPPLESRLVSADISQRLKVAKNPQHCMNIDCESPTPDTRCEETLQSVYLKQQAEEKKGYMEMAKRREEIITLFKKQREEQIKKEMMSLPYKPNQCDSYQRPPPKEQPKDIQQDIDDVRALEW
ncbi:cilia- and flagella-associated protein HOATZ isoform X1 [Megalops cyprinoides]|uniref:cilia- and flagella-associated protein HOATZ isoform X1 n=1 Tax=Megalops cyprinoides TaxID=118141 RepID=UPI0018652AA1|nr:cilia- and flagella-associated protein HOATZ isoform X1 [Megalops cyprinoides]